MASNCHQQCSGASRCLSTCSEISFEPFVVAENSTSTHKKRQNHLRKKSSAGRLISSTARREKQTIAVWLLYVVCNLFTKWGSAAFWVAKFSGTFSSFAGGTREWWELRNLQNARLPQYVAYCVGVAVESAIQPHNQIFLGCEGALGCQLYMSLRFGKRFIEQMSGTYRIITVKDLWFFFPLGQHRGYTTAFFLIFWWNVE